MERTRTFVECTRTHHTTHFCNLHNCRTERTLHFIIKSIESQGGTYRNCSGTYQNVPPKHHACTKTGKNVPELFRNVSERITKHKTNGRTYQNVSEPNGTFTIIAQQKTKGGFPDTAIYIYREREREREILRLHPCRQPSWLQGTAGCLTPEMGDFLYLKLLFWRP